MNITIHENSNLSETEIVINCNHMDDELLKILALLRTFDQKLTGIRDGKTYILNLDNVLYFDTVDKKTFIYTMSDVYETPLKLYELEERLSGNGFFRSSKSTIIHFDKIKSLKPEFGGKLQVTMCNDEKLFVSRQYVPNVKKKLGI